MKSLELNGVANILMEAYIAQMNGEISEDAYRKIEKQCNFLEAYFKAANKSLAKDAEIPYWHDVVAEVKRTL
jgi:hypothetical protein